MVSIPPFQHLTSEGRDQPTEPSGTTTAAFIISPIVLISEQFQGPQLTTFTKAASGHLETRGKSQAPRAGNLICPQSGRPGGQRNEETRVNIFKVHFMHVWKCQEEASHYLPFNIR
jgi:hypothetical protein